MGFWKAFSHPLVSVIWIHWMVIDLAMPLYGTEATVQSRIAGGFFGHPPEGLSINGQTLQPSVIEDVLVLSDQTVLVCGTTNSLQLLPQTPNLYKLLDGAVGTNMGFVAKFSPALTQCRWVAVFPYNCIVPTRLAEAPDRAIVVGGRMLPRLLGLVPESQRPLWSNSQGVLAKLTRDGQRVIWARPGGQHANNITGLALDAKGIVYWTGGSRERGQPAYVFRCKPDGTDLLGWMDRADPERQWALELHHDNPELGMVGQFWHFYKHAGKRGFDYDGEGGYERVRFGLQGIRRGGGLTLLPGGDLVVSGTMQFDFKIGDGKRYPAFDLFLARFTAGGLPQWSTNLYQPGESVHVPDEKAEDLIFDHASGDLILLARQHGRGDYQLAGDLPGDPGNQSVSWVGKVHVKSGRVKAGWFFVNRAVSEAESPGGLPLLSGNHLRRVRTDPQGRVYLVGMAGAGVETVGGALQDWPESQKAGEHGCVIILSHDLQEVLFSTVLRGENPLDAHRWPRVELRALGLNRHGIVVAGRTETADLPMEAVLPWSVKESGYRDGGAFIGLLQFSAPETVAPLVSH